MGETTPEFVEAQVENFKTLGTRNTADRFKIGGVKTQFVEVEGASDVIEAEGNGVGIQPEKLEIGKIKE